MSHNLLADIGNTHCHIYNGQQIEHLSHQEALAKYAHKEVYYICVKSSLLPMLHANALWQDISKDICLKGSYKGMGIDRQALCLSRPTGIFVDAGSAITVDVVKEGVYQGGYILLGLKATLQAYASISPILDIKLNNKIDLHSLPKTTKDGISYGIIAPIKALLQTHNHPLQTLYFTGGDGKFLSSFFTDAIYDEKLVFEGMERGLSSLSK